MALEHDKQLISRGILKELIDNMQIFVIFVLYII